MSTLLAKPKILALGGAGIKICSHLKAGVLADFDILGVDLGPTLAPFEIISIGNETLELFGSGGDPEVARRAAEGKQELLNAKLQGANLVFIVAGLGGGTASALAPLLAEMALKTSAIVVNFVTLPFSVEGSRRTAQAKESLASLRATGSVVIPISNDALLRAAPADSTTAKVMEQTEAILGQSIRSFTSMTCVPGLLEVDFDVLKKILLGHSNKTLFALGTGSGENALQQAFTEIASSPFLHSPEVARYADHLVVSIKASPDIGLKEINALTAQLAEKFGARGEKIVGATVEPSWNQHLEVMLIGQPDPEIRKKQATIVQAAANAAREARKKASPPSAQTEFGFNKQIEERGFFEATEPNLYRGEDVDVPTYLRRNIKVTL